MFIARPGVRTRILAIALVPSLALLVVGVGASGYLVARGKHTEDWAAAMQQLIDPSTELVRAVQAERRLTLARFAGDPTAASALTSARARLDAGLVTIIGASQPLIELGLDDIDPRYESNTDMLSDIADARAAIDAGVLDVRAAYQLYNQLAEVAISGGRMTQRTSPDPAASMELADARALLYASESLSRANAVALAMTTTGTRFAVTPDEFAYHTGHYRTQIANLAADPDFGRRGELETLMTSPEWTQVAAMEAAIVQRWAVTGFQSSAAGLPPLPLSIAEWQSFAEHINDDIIDVWIVQNRNAHALAQEVGRRDATTYGLAGAGLLIISVGAFLVAVVLANRIIRRLRGLRRDTLALADDRLPDMMRRLAAGEVVDPAAETPNLDYGTDEIGQVAKAFQHAHAAAVDGAVREAGTREGVKSVFLDIAHRSQVVVHRQLELLDEAESKQVDPDVLETLFRIDHLATRARRNAENLIILGGGRPGRQWHAPVPLIDLVRSAVAETVDYTRVRIGRFPGAYVVGTVVADFVHLLAELVDNAASFSPRHSKVEITGAVVGRGIAVEISDQGMGMTEDALDKANEMLRQPPDFGVARLSEDSRIGLFVVSHLAARNHISVRLSDSDYGGVRAIVLVPTGLLADEPERPDRTEPPRAPYRRLLAETGLLTGELPAVPETPEPLTALMAAAPAPIEPPRPVVVAPPPTTEGRPQLPRRVRQANLSPQLLDAPSTGATESVTTERERSPEQARNLMSAIENGTRQGRRVRLSDEHEQEGHGDRSQDR